MKIVFVLLALVACVVAAPIDEKDKQATVLRYDNDNIGVGPYNFE